MRSFACRTFLVCAVVATSSYESALASLASDLSDLSGGSRVKVVWSDGSSLGGWRTGTSMTLKGFDTQAGSVVTIKGSTSNYSRPLITYDGTRVVYTNQSTGKVYVCGWNGSNTTEVFGGYGGCLWYDASSGKEYVVAAKGAWAKEGSEGSLHTLRRARREEHPPLCP